MTNEPDPAPPAAVMVRHHWHKLVWIIPLIAALATGWLELRSYSNYGPKISISFDNAAGLEAGRTQIKHKNVVLGTVETITPSSDFSHVVVTARMDKAAEPYLADGAYFWMVKPSFSSRDLSGLGTLISGAYIEFEPGNGNAKREFVGEQSPTFIPAEEPGAIFTLHAARLGSIGRGAAVYFHGVIVGRVLGYDISDKDGSVAVRIIVDEHYREMVHTGMRFWNTSGVTVGVGSNGFKMQLESIESLLVGGIAFDLPFGAEKGPVADDKTRFTLYPDEASAEDSVYTRRIRFLLHFNQDVSGLFEGSLVRLQGIMVGRVNEMHIDYGTKNRLSVSVIVEVEPERLKLRWNGDEAYYNVFRNLVENGLRARLGSENLLTGQKVVDLDILPNTPAAVMADTKPYPEIPVVASDDLASVMRAAKGTLGNIDKTLKKTDDTLSGDDDGSPLASTLDEVKNAARSVRSLSDYLETHPEAVLKGKPEDPTR
jgi:paraquat-inducible protein B